MIDTVHRTLARLAAEAIAAAAPGVAVSIGPPELADNAFGLNWFLYALRPVESMRIRPGPGRDGSMPLALDLRYLLSVHHGPMPPPDHTVRLAVALGAVLQAVHEHPVVPAADDGQTTVRIEHDPLDTEALATLWRATGAPLRTAATFRVTTAPLLPLT